MKKFIFKFSITLLIIFLINPVYATARPFAYSAEKDGKTIHLLGTLHFSVSFEQLPCHNEIAEHLNTSDLFFSELTTHSPTLLKYLGNDIGKIFTASVTEKEKMLSHLSEHERESVNKIIELYERQTIEGLQKIFRSFGIQLVDKAKEPFEALNPQLRELLISRGVSVQRNYVDYLYLIVSSLVLKDFFSASLDIQIAKIAQSKNIPIKLLDNNNSIMGYIVEAFGISQTEKNKGIEITEMELDSENIYEFSTGLSGANMTPPPLKEAYLSGNKEAVLQYIDKASLNDKAIEILLKNRNKLWLQKITEAFESQEYESIFVAGGLAHLIGSFNILDKLEEDGFTVRRLSCSGEN